MKTTWKHGFKCKNQYGFIDVDAFLNAFKESYDRGDKYFYLDGFRFKTGSQRYELFASKGITCVTCGVEGNVFVVESHSDDVRPHANLYHVDGDTKILMTKDHIIPKSKGGKNELSNYNTMCSPCNGDKGDAMEGETAAA